MTTITQIIIVITTYLASLGIYYATNQKILNLITKDGYTPKNGDLNSLWYELNIPNTQLTRVMAFFPYTNLIASLIEGIINLKTYDEILIDLKQKDIIVPMNQEEKQYFKLKEETFKASTEITIARERELECQNNYSIEENALKEQLLNNQKYYKEIDLISNSKISYQYKIELLNILKYCITNNINNLNISELIKSIERKDNIVNPLYLQLFYLENEVDNESLKTIIYSINKIINNTEVDTLEKENYLNQIVTVIYSYLKELSKKEKQNLDLKINLDIDTNNIENSDFTIKKVKTTKEHH